jgi:hypothetical protein
MSNQREGTVKTSRPAPLKPVVLERDLVTAFGFRSKLQFFDCQVLTVAQAKPHL